MTRPTKWELLIDRWRHPLAAICFALSCASAYCGVVDVRQHDNQADELQHPPAETVTDNPQPHGMPAVNAGASVDGVSIAFAYERMPRL